jgi:hypothetical protein
MVGGPSAGRPLGDGRGGGGRSQRGLGFCHDSESCVFLVGVAGKLLKVGDSDCHFGIPLCSMLLEAVWVLRLGSLNGNRMGE